MRIAASGVALLAVGVLRVTMAHAAPEKGTVVQTDTLGMSVVSYNLDTSKTTTVADSAGLSEFVGLHYFFADAWRVGLNLQFTELLSTPPPAGSRFSTFGVLPQIGWHFYGPLFAAAVFAILPRSGGGANVDLGVLGLFGVAFPVAERASVTATFEVPYYFEVHRTVGLTPLLGIALRL